MGNITHFKLRRINSDDNQGLIIDLLAEENYSYAREIIMEMDKGIKIGYLKSPYKLAIIESTSYYEDDLDCLLDFIKVSLESKNFELYTIEERNGSLYFNTKKIISYEEFLKYIIDNKYGQLETPDNEDMEVWGAETDKGDVRFIDEDYVDCFIRF